MIDAELPFLCYVLNGPLSVQMDGGFPKLPSKAW